MLTDYKFKYIIRNGTTTVVKASYYEGDLTESKYIRSALLKDKITEHQGDLSDSSLKSIYNIELAKDLTRTPIDQQK